MSTRKQPRKPYPAKVRGGRRNPAPKKSGRLSQERRIIARPPPKAPPKQKKKTSWWEKLKKAFGIGKDIVEFALPFFMSHPPAQRGSLRLSNSKSGSSTVPLATPVAIKTGGYPHVSTDRNGTYTFKHRALITQLSIEAGKSAGDKLLSIDLTPGIEPWLSEMSCFEKYRFIDVVIAYKPLCSATTDGGLVGYWDYDVDSQTVFDQGIASLQGAMSHHSAESTNVWKCCGWHMCNREEPTEWWYVAQQGQERRFTTQAVFNLLAATDFSSAVAAGELEVMYHVEFMKADLTSRYNGSFSCHRAKSTATVTGDAPFGTTDTDLERVTVWNSDAMLAEDEVPQTIPIRYYVKSTGEGVFQLPKGFFTVAVRLGTTGTIDVITSGTYAWLQYLRVGDTATSNLEYESATGSAASAWGVLESTGYEEGAPDNYFRVSSSVAPVNESQITFTSCAPPPFYREPFSSLQSRRLTFQVSKLVEEKLKELLPKDDEEPPIPPLTLSRRRR